LFWGSSLLPTSLPACHLSAERARPQRTLTIERLAGRQQGADRDADG
jgi:hypothetical protein